MHGPFPGFIIQEDDGNIKWWNEGCQQDPYVGIYDWHDDLIYSSTLEMAEEWDEFRREAIEEIYSTTDVRLSSLIFFWTSFARVEPFDQELPMKESSDREKYKTDLEQMKMMILAELIAIRQLDNGSIFVNESLQAEELKDISVQLESSEVNLVYIGMISVNFGKMCLMLVHWEDGIARRIFPHMLFHIDPTNWEDRCSGRILVVLG